jgi:hypothetical protein
MLSIQKSGTPVFFDGKDKVKFVAQVYPQISLQAQEYLEKIAHTMLLIQNPGAAPISKIDDIDEGQ